MKITLNELDIKRAINLYLERYIDDKDLDNEINIIALDEGLVLKGYQVIAELNILREDYVNN